MAPKATQKCKTCKQIVVITSHNTIIELPLTFLIGHLKTCLILCLFVLLQLSVAYWSNMLLLVHGGFRTQGAGSGWSVGCEDCCPPSVSVSDRHSAACWISAFPSVPLFFLWIWRSKSQSLPASNSRWRASTDFLHAQLRLITREHCSFWSSFLQSSLPTCAAGSDTFLG